MVSTDSRSHKRRGPGFDTKACMTGPASSTRFRLKRSPAMERSSNTHRSSLSLAPHCVSAALAGLRDEAYMYFLRAGSTDLRSHWWDDDGGLHAAACGAMPLALMIAFAGMRANGETLTFSPKLPSAWKRVRFKVRFRGQTREFLGTSGGG